MQTRWINIFAGLNGYRYLLGMHAANNRKRYSNSLSLPLVIMIVLMLSGSVWQVQASDYRKIVQLSGYWKFSVGDYSEWSEPGYNDSNWDELRVPGKWEDQGYSDYSGFAWYRKKFKIYDVDATVPLYLIIGTIDDVDEVYLNGKLLGTSGTFPPHFITAYNMERRYLIPREYLNFNGVNTLAIRVYDGYLEGGIVQDPVGIYADETYKDLDHVFPNLWKFHLGDNSQWKSPSYDDGAWEEISVPASWEQQGYPNYDGYAWYRLNFRVPTELRGEKLYVALGKIDDEDYVYLNGHLIGTVFDLPKDGEYKRRGYEYNARRVYEIPSELLNERGENVLAVRVYDGQIRGGIYEGPLGLMTYNSYKAYYKKHYSNQSFIDYLIDVLND